MTFRIFSAPNWYIQGPGALVELAAVMSGYGRQPFIVADAATLLALRGRIEDLIGALVERVVFGQCGESCTAAEIERMIEAAREFSSDLVIGLGSGAAVDVAKGLSLALGLPLISVPTTATCHAPVGRVIIVHGDGEQPAETRVMPTGPDLVLVDTAIIAAGAPRHFIAALGDALALTFEIEQFTAAGQRNVFAGRPSLMAQAAAEACYRAIREHAPAALAALTRHEPNEALETVVEAVILAGGIAFENGGASIAHVLARNFASLPACRTALHGELVAFGLLPQLLLQERPAGFLAELVSFYRQVGLPARLSEIGLVAERNTAFAAVAAQISAGVPLPIDARQLMEAITRIDTLSYK
jgi:glycerol dehydrogenase